MHRHSPLMRSLLSQSQTPTAPRSAVGFFRFGCLTGCPARLITQSTSGQQVLFRCPFQPSTEITLTERSKKSTQTIGAMYELPPVNNVGWNPLNPLGLEKSVLISDWIFTRNCTTDRQPKNRRRYPTFGLTRKNSRRILLVVEKNHQCQNSWLMWTVVPWAILGRRVLGW